MKIVITGANSAVGQAILRCGSENGASSNALVAAVRSDRAAQEIRPLLGKESSAALISYDDPASLDGTFKGASAIIHLAGILVERPGSRYEQANVAPARSVVEAAKRCGVEKLVLISATGADETSSNGYYRSKGQEYGALAQALRQRYDGFIGIEDGPGPGGEASAPASLAMGGMVSRPGLGGDWLTHSRSGE